MILRRFMKHTSEQNWYAVGLDVIVVITGIFLGMQVTEWKNDLNDKAWEAEFMVDLKNDLQRDAKHLSSVIDFQTVKGQRLRTVKASLLKWKELDPKEFGIQFRLARTGNNTFFPTHGVYEAAMASSKIHLFTNKVLRNQIMNLHGRTYVRISLSGQMYDGRIEKVAWQGLEIFDPHEYEFINWDGNVRNYARMESTYLLRQNEIFLEMAEITRIAIDNAIQALSDEIAK